MTYDEAYVQAVGKATRLNMDVDLWKNAIDGYMTSLLSRSDRPRGEVVHPGQPLTTAQIAIRDRA